MKKTTVSVTPGICGFECKVNATRKSKKTATIEIIGSECKMINNLAANAYKKFNFQMYGKGSLSSLLSGSHCHHKSCRGFSGTGITEQCPD
jgi:hypothetical protein